MSPFLQIAIVETAQAAGWFLLGDVVGDVHHLLLRGVEAEHLHGGVQVLQQRALTREVVLRQRNNETTRPDLSEMFDNVQNSLLKLPLDN